MVEALTGREGSVKAPNLTPRPPLWSASRQLAPLIVRAAPTKTRRDQDLSWAKISPAVSPCLGRFIRRASFSRSSCLRSFPVVSPIFDYRDRRFLLIFATSRLERCTLPNLPFPFPLNTAVPVRRQADLSRFQSRTRHTLRTPVSTANCPLSCA